MRKEDKSTIIEQIAATVKEYGHFYLIDTTAMNAADTSALRALCFKADIHSYTPVSASRTCSVHDV